MKKLIKNLIDSPKMPKASAISSNWCWKIIVR